MTTSSGTDAHNISPDFLNKLREDLLKTPQSRYGLAPSPDEADAIIYFEPDFHKFKSYPRRLMQEELIRRHPNKCFVVDSVDGPIGFLPGVYACMPRDRWDADRFRAGCYLWQYNTLSTTFAAQRHVVRPTLLFSFRGSASHPIREAIFRAGIAGPDSPIRQTFQWFDHTEDEKREYIEEMLQSRFVLAPRGLGTASIRLFEVMELGRVPVILSDQWVPPVGPAWPDFSIRVAESRVAEIPDLLRQRAAEAEDMGRLARRAWEEWFSPEVRLTRTLQAIEDLRLTRPAAHDEAYYRDQWLTWRFTWEQGWNPLQSFVRVVKQGALGDQVRRRIRKGAGGEGTS